MGILSRFKSIMSANINALLDKVEDPSKMVDQLLRELSDDLGKVKAETAGIMAEESRAKRALDECVAEIAKMQAYAEKAVTAGNDDDARAFLKRKTQLTEKQVALTQGYDLAAANAVKMRQMHDKLTEQIADLNARRDTIKAKVAVAKTQERVNKLGESMGSADEHLSAFDRLEQKADNMLDRANAMAELNQPASSGVTELAKKYDADPAEIEDELAALKSRMGK